MIRSSKQTKKKLQNVVISFNTLQYVRLYSAIKRRNDEPAILFIHNVIQSMKSACQFAVSMVCRTKHALPEFARDKILQNKNEFDLIKVVSMVVLVNCNNFFCD